MPSIHEISASFKLVTAGSPPGEHGKGFAVVAEEVGNLAQMSANAAKEISTMLEGSLQKVERLVSNSRDKVEVGTRVASQCGEVLDEIVDHVSSVTTMAGEIAKASHEQARGITEITRAMSQLDQVTQQNAASSEEAASSPEELSAPAEALAGLVRELMTTIQRGQPQQSFAAQSHSLKPWTQSSKAMTRVLMRFKKEGERYASYA